MQIASRPTTRRSPRRRSQAPQYASSAGTEDTLAQLRELGELKAQGILTEEEFAIQKARILA